MSAARSRVRLRGATTSVAPEQSARTQSAVNTSNSRLAVLRIRSAGVMP